MPLSLFWFPAAKRNFIALFTVNQKAATFHPLFTFFIMRPAFIIASLGSLMAVAIGVNLSGNKSFSAAKVADHVQSNRAGESKVAEVVAQANRYHASAGNQVVEQYLQVLFADYANLEQAVKTNRGAAKKAGYFLCTVSGLEEWSKTHKKQALVHWTRRLKEVLLKFISEQDPARQAESFQQLAALVNEMMQPPPRRN